MLGVHFMAIFIKPALKLIFILYQLRVKFYKEALPQAAFCDSAAKHNLKKTHCNPANELAKIRGYRQSIPFFENKEKF